MHVPKVAQYILYHVLCNPGVYRNGASVYTFAHGGVLRILCKRECSPGTAVATFHGQEI